MKPNRKNRILLARLSFPLASALAALLATTSVHAGQTWDGGGADDNWNTAGNWDGTAPGVLPTFTNAITFTGNTRNGAVNNLTANTTIGGILFTNDGSAGKTNAFTLSGNAITLGGNITTTANTAGSTITDIISLNMILNGTRTITTNIQTGGTGVQHNLSISGNITEDVAGRGLTKAGSGILTLSGTNNYSGVTTVNNAGGTLKIDAASALPSGSQINLLKSGTSSGTLLMNTSGTNVYNNTFGNFTASFTTVVGGQANIRNAQGDNTFTGNMNVNATGGTGVILQSDAGTLRIAGNLTNTLSGFRLFEFAGAGSSVFSGQANNTSGTLGVALLKSGSGTLSITGTDSSFTGGVTLLQGVLNVASVADTGTNSSIGAGGAITLTGQGTSGTFQYTGSTAVTTNHALNVAATGGTLDASGTGSGTLKFTGTFTATNPAVFNLNFTNGSNVATNTASASPGTVAGNVMTATATGLPVGTTITSISGNSYTLSNPSGTTGELSTTFGIVARTLTLTGSNGGANEISSTLANSSGGGVLGINKTGEGAWTLSGTNTYTGPTNVQGGTLVISGNISTSVSTNVAANATLGGGGTVGALSFDGGSYFDIFDAIGGNPLDSTTISIGSAGFGIDNLVSQGAAVNWGTIADGTYTLITGTLNSLNLDNFGLANAFDIDGISGSRSAYFQNGSLQLVVIPEPRAALLGGLGLLALLRRRRNGALDGIKP